MEFPRELLAVVDEMMRLNPGMADIARKLAIMDAMLVTDSSDVNVIAQQMFIDKEGIFPVELMKEMIEYYMPDLIEEGLVVDGKLTDVAKGLALEHIAMLSEDEVRN